MISIITIKERPYSSGCELSYMSVVSFCIIPSKGEIFLFDLPVTVFKRWRVIDGSERVFIARDTSGNTL